MLCITGIGVPLAVLYLLTGTVRMETDVDDPEQLAEDLYTGKLAGNQGRKKNPGLAVLLFAGAVVFLLLALLPVFMQGWGLLEMLLPLLSAVALIIGGVEAIREVKPS